MYDTEKSTYNYIKVDKSCQMKYMKMHQNIRSECYCFFISFFRPIANVVLRTTITSMHPLFLNMRGGLCMQQQTRQWWRQATQMVHEAAHQPNVFEQWIEQLASRDSAITV